MKKPPVYLSEIF